VIPILLRDLRWRLAGLVGLAWVLYLLEPGFHQHGALGPGEAVALGPVGVSATLSYFSGLAMIVLLAGFVSTDRREGYTRIFFAHPTRPLAFYGLRLAVALGIAVLGAALFLVIGQMVAWGEIRGGWSGLLLALVAAIIYGGLMSFLSATLPRGDAVIASLLMVVPTFIPQIFGMALAGMPSTLRQVILVVLPPQGALQVIWQRLLEGAVAWPAVLFATGYGLVWLCAAALVLRARELP
jgi:hypothetical protein